MNSIANYFKTQHLVPDHVIVIGDLNEYDEKISTKVQLLRTPEYHSNAMEILKNPIETFDGPMCLVNAFRNSQSVKDLYLPLIDHILLSTSLYFRLERSLPEFYRGIERYHQFQKIVIRMSPKMRISEGSGSNILDNEKTFNSDDRKKEESVDGWIEFSSNKRLNREYRISDSGSSTSSYELEKEKMFTGLEKEQVLEEVKKSKKRKSKKKKVAVVEKEDIMEETAPPKPSMFFTFKKWFGFN